MMTIAVISSALRGVTSNAMGVIDRQTTSSGDRKQTVGTGGVRDRNSCDGQDALIYVVSREGHRGPYLDLFCPLLGLHPVYGVMSPKMFVRLVGARKLLFATLDDDMASFTLVTIIRSLVGRPTSALFLRAAQCFIPRKIKYRLKLQFFRILRLLPRLTLMTITPFCMESRYRLVAHTGVHDPQYWDKHDGAAIIPPSRTELSECVRQQADERKIVCLPGSLSGIKGFEFLTDMLVSAPRLLENIFVVAAGRVPVNMRKVAKKFVKSGGVLINRRISDKELESLYGISDMIWSCYRPEYDQPSGIFGRAMQFGVPVLVRKGSQIDRLAQSIGLPAVQLEFGNVAKAVRLLQQEPPQRLQGSDLEQHNKRIGKWRAHFLATINSSLETRK